MNTLQHVFTNSTHFLSFLMSSSIKKNASVLLQIMSSGSSELGHLTVE